jgi:hypothetical protein
VKLLAGQLNNFFERLLQIHFFPQSEDLRGRDPGWFRSSPAALPVVHR